MHGSDYVKLKNSVRVLEQHSVCFIKVKVSTVWEGVRFISDERVKRNRIEWENCKIYVKSGGTRDNDCTMRKISPRF
jgi:hypothetical protein